ncbi:MAG: hypothetical protein IJ069_11015 [Prevotella sp.]|nr:hypothetical protein [Prevotella sp.]
MKQILLSIILTLTCLQSHAQNITGIHTLRIDDKVEKQLVEYELNDESAMNMVWDLRDLSDLMITRTDPMIPKENGADGRLWKKK